MTGTPAPDHGRRAAPSDPIVDTGKTVADFWEWAFGDLVTNTVRSVFAEYLVAIALGVSDQPRVEWDMFDLRYRDVGIEVKAVGRVQAWTAPARIGTPRFDIAAKLYWDAASNRFATVPGRPAAVWVFAECTAKEASSALVEDPANWRFHVVPTSWLDDLQPPQRSIVITRLAVQFPAVAFDGLRAAVDEALRVTRSLLDGPSA